MTVLEIEFYCIYSIFKFEPHLIPIETETFNLRSANTNDDSRLDVKARGFWTRDQTAFFDIRVTHVGSQSNKNRDTYTVFRQHELEKKHSICREY